MHEVLSAPAPLSATASKTASRPGPFAVLLFGAAAFLLMLAANIFWREEYTGDEGFYTVTAQNMLLDADYLVRPSYLPAGDFAADKGGFAHPPFNSYLYALGLWGARGSLAGPEVIHALGFAALLFFAYRLLVRIDAQSAMFAVLLLAASPGLIAAYSMLEAESLMTTFGVASLYCCVRGGFGDRYKRWLFLGGLCLGMAFAFKLWLCGPLVLAAGAALLVQAWHARAGLAKFGVGLAVFVGAALLPASAHLLAVAATHPEDLRFWLNDVYFGIFTKSGISGTKLGGDNIATQWAHPVWYYGAALYRDHFFIFPIILFGSGALLRDLRVRSSLLFVLTAGIIGLAPLSLMKVKEPLYILPCTVFLYLLAAICLAALARRLASGSDIDPFSRRLGTVVTTALLVVFPLAYLRGLKPDDITREFVIAHSAVLAAILITLAWARRKKSTATFERTVYIACAIAVILGFAHHALARKPRDEAIARLAAPYITENSPRTLSMIASNFKGYQTHLFRRGVYWHELNLDASPDAILRSEPFATVRVFILSPFDQARPAVSPWVQWLEKNATEKTRELDAQLRKSSGFRVFVRET